MPNKVPPSNTKLLLVTTAVSATVTCVGLIIRDIVKPYTNK